MAEIAPLSLDQSQHAVVHSNAKYLQVVGYPGSGKTLVMARHIARLIADGVKPSSIVALTFTSSAQITLRKGIEHAIRENQDPVLPETHAKDMASATRIHTFHAFSNELITNYGSDIGIPPESGMFDFLDPHNLYHNPLSGLKRLKGYPRSPSSLPPKERAELRAFMTKYKTYDFDSALEYAIEILAKRDLGISYVFLDEFQDCTNLQWKLVKAVIAGNPDVRMVACGDPNQEIFRFQEDHFCNAFRRMREEFPETKTLELLYNYRSTPEIVETAHSILGKAEAHPHGRIRAVLPHGPEPEMIQCAWPEQETEGIVNLIKRLNTVDHFDHSDVAILVRTQADISYFTELLERNLIPNQSVFSIRGLGVKKLPSVALTLLKWAQDAKDVYLIQLLYNRMCYYIRESTFKGLQARIMADEQSGRSSTLTQDLIELNPRLYSRPFLLEWLPSLRARLVASRTPGEIAMIVNEAMVKWSAKAGLKVNVTNADRIDWTNFMNYLDTVTSTVESEEGPASEDGVVLSTVLKKLYAPEHTDAGRLQQDAFDKVTVSTIHSAKSREWPVVILPSVPLPRFGIDKPIDAVRLQYVAASRAQKRLYFFNTGTAPVGSRNSFVPIRTVLQPVPFISASQAVKLYPLVFRPVLRV